jgi:hypothetical protein
MRDRCLRRAPKGTRRAEATGAASCGSVGRWPFGSDGGEPGLALALSAAASAPRCFISALGWRLLELGVLKQLNSFSSVSGGSMYAGVLASSWDALAPFQRRRGRVDIIEKVNGLVAARYVAIEIFRANRRRLQAPIVTQSRSGIEQLQPMPNCRDAKLLQRLVRQARKDRLVYLILAECRLILPEAQAPQPDHDVHDNAPKLWVAVPWSCPERVSTGPRGNRKQLALGNHTAGN